MGAEPGESPYSINVKSGLPPMLVTTAQNEDSVPNDDSDLKIATVVEIAVGCTLAVFVFIIAIVMVCRKSRGNGSKMCILPFGKLEEEQKWVKVMEMGDYDAIDRGFHPQRNQRHLSLSAGLPEVSSLAKLYPRSKSDGDAKCTEGTSGNALTFGSNSGSRSPAITRSLRHGAIPFTLPPMGIGKSSSTGSGLVERVQPYHPRSFSENDTPLSAQASIREEEFTSTNLDTSEEDVGNPAKPVEVKLGSTGNFRNSLFGQIQPELYKYSEHEEHDLPPSQFGRIWFSLVYDAAVEALTVKVIKVRQLPGRGSNVPHDCFVKLFLLPDERMSQQTKIKRRTNNPRFNETFVFQASASDIKERTLRLSVYDVDKRKVARHLLGHALVTLSDVELLSQSDDVMWRDLDERAHPGDSGTSLGEVNISLSYLPSLNRLTVVVLRARNLREIDLEATGVYVKVTLTQGHQVIKTRKTTIKRGDCDPNYNESFGFTITAKDIESACLSINVITLGYHYGIRQLTTSFKNLVSTGKPTNEHKYGRVVVGSFMFCRGEQLLHWQEMLAQPRKSISKWHPLSEVAAHD